MRNFFLASVLIQSLLKMVAAKLFHLNLANFRCINYNFLIDWFLQTDSCVSWERKLNAIQESFVN